MTIEKTESKTNGSISKEQFIEMIALYMSLNAEHRKEAKEKCPDFRDVFILVDKKLEAK